MHTYDDGAHETNSGPARAPTLLQVAFNQYTSDISGHTKH